MQQPPKALGNTLRHTGFSLIELVIVIVIIGVIGAIAIPRMTRGATNAGSAALKGDLQVLRQAVELYRAEHDGAYPDQSAFVEQMTKRTDLDGTVNASAGEYGPYLAGVPELPVGANKGETGVVATGSTPSATPAGAWVYDNSTGTVTPLTADSATDQDGKAYNTY